MCFLSLQTPWPEFWFVTFYPMGDHFANEVWEPPSHAISFLGFVDCFGNTVTPPGRALSLFSSVCPFSLSLFSISLPLLFAPFYTHTKNPTKALFRALITSPIGPRLSFGSGFIELLADSLVLLSQWEVGRRQRPAAPKGIAWTYAQLWVERLWDLCLDMCVQWPLLAKQRQTMRLQLGPRSDKEKYMWEM